MIDFSLLNFPQSFLESYYRNRARVFSRSYIFCIKKSKVFLETSSEDQTICICPSGTIEGSDDKCIECAEGEVANDNQTGCVGMSDWTFLNTGQQTLYTRP